MSQTASFGYAKEFIVTWKCDTEAKAGEDASVGESNANVWTTCTVFMHAQYDPQQIKVN